MLPLRLHSRWTLGQRSWGDMLPLSILIASDALSELPVGAIQPHQPKVPHRSFAFIWSCVVESPGSSERP